MLRATFQHLVRGVTAAAEAELWKKGIFTWEAYEKTLPFQRDLFKETAANDSPLSPARQALRSGDAQFFAARLHPWEYFRIALAFSKKTLFLDLETTGLSRYYDIITMVGWSYRGQYGALIRGDDPSRLRSVLDRAKVIVTFNGSLFDLPFLRGEYPGFSIPPVHIDLRFLGKRVGLTGGQKAIEQVLGFKRPRDLRTIQSEMAPLLWHQYRRGDLDALRLLVRYNHADIEGMKFLLDQSIARLLRAREVPLTIRKIVPTFSDGPKTLIHKGPQGPSIPRAVRIVRYAGRVGPALTLNSLRRGLSTDSLRIVGIDLTGSESRPSGWCALSDGEAVTRMLV